LSDEPEVAPAAGIRQRSCLVCHQHADKAGLLRLVVDEDAQVWPDILQKAPGRGAYVCWQGKCLSHIHARQLARAWKGRAVADGQAALLLQRAGSAVLQLCRRALRRQRNRLDIGRDAVMHRMWGKAPMLLLLASDAGAALSRQIRDACGKRKTAGLKTALVIFADSAKLGDLVERDTVAVLALDDSPACASLRQCCLWYGQLGEME